MGKNQVLRTVGDIDLQGKNVLIRLDLDVPISDGEITDDSRLLMTWPTVEAVTAAQPEKVTIIGHLGRPKGNSEFRIPRPRLGSAEGGHNSEFKVGPVREWYRKKLAGYKNWELWENLRFNPGEETNSQGFAKEIVRRSQAGVFIFEAFAAAHQPHASVISVPKLVAETAVGFRFAEEIRNLSKIWQNPKRPVVFMLGGSKIDTKLGLIPKLAEQADKVLIGGLLPKKIQNSKFKIQNYKSKLKIAELNSEGTDISEKSAKEFAEEILKAGSVIWNGPMGLFEKPINALTYQRINALTVKGTSAWGTWTVAKAIRETAAFTVAGGGDTEAALTKLGGADGIDWISSGGGAMLYYLAHHTLPFLEAIRW